MVDSSNKIKTQGSFWLKVIQSCLLFGVALTATPTFADTGKATIKEAKVVQAKNQDAVISITLDKPVAYKVFALQSPDRVVVDLKQTNSQIELDPKNSSVLKKVRHASRNNNDLRIVLDLATAATPKASMKGKMLQIALHTVKPKPSSKAKTKPPTKVIKKKSPTSAPVVPTKPRRGDFIVAIDAGHGGKDPGAVGAKGTYEKDIVLQISKKLKERIDRARGMRAVLVRNADYYVPLRKRMEIARQHHADLFISIHADANPNRHLKGSSVYILSQNGASSEAARWLASNENSYETKLGGTKIDDKDNTLATMLMDLSQAATIDNSLNLANNTLRELGAVNKLLHRRVESAAFVVLKSPDIPSMLVETAFISNPSEEQRLKTPQYQSKLANAIFKGVKNYQVAHAPGGKLKMYADNDKNQHVVKAGESLSVIAEKYGLTTNTLSHHNQLSNTTIRVGQRLYIPTRS